MKCHCCERSLADAVEIFRLDDDPLCDTCAASVTEIDASRRFLQIIEAVDGIPLSEADILLEAVRIHRRITTGPTTHPSAKEMLANWDAREF